MSLGSALPYVHTPSSAREAAICIQRLFGNAIEIQALLGACIL